jgi:hypothetical protein
MVGRCLDGRVERGGLPVDERVGVETLRRVVFEPVLAEAAGALGLDDPVTLGVQLDVIADATAKRTRRVLNDLKAHRKTPRIGITL